MSLSARLPLSVVGFLRTYVDSLEKLMLLLLVHRAPSGTVSVPVAARLIDVSINQARRIAAELADRGLVRVSRADQIELTVPSIEDRLALADLSEALLRAGVVCTHEQDDCAGWWFDPKSAWATTIEILLEIYEMNRADVLRLMKHVAFEQVRARRIRGSSFPATRSRRIPTEPS